MGGMGSGRPKPGPPAPVELPAMGESELSIARYAAAVAHLLELGMLEPARAREMIGAARVAMVGCKRTAERIEIDELQALLKNAQALSQGNRMKAPGGKPQS